LHMASSVILPGSNLILHHVFNVPSVTASAGDYIVYGAGTAAAVVQENAWWPYIVSVPYSCAVLQRDRLFRLLGDIQFNSPAGQPLPLKSYVHRVMCKRIVYC
jgi:hypothetical protein